MDTPLQERISLDKLVAWCRRVPVKRLWVFGSVLADWTPESDVDLLVEFLPGQEPDLLGRLDLQDELVELLGRPVDLIPQEAVTNPFRRQRIWSTRREIYAA
jgi:predicted nucleotidyltransferase